MTDEPEHRLYLRFHGRIIDSLGIQMYQSPVAAIAELIANAWDADAKTVEVELPATLRAGSEIVVTDTGSGMSFEECQTHYLNVGRNRRLDDGTDNSRDGRPILGRKGIGKFAGFGIAEVVQIETTSKETGERTIFRLDLRDLRGEDYIDTSAREVEVLLAEGADEARKASSGTKVTLQELKLARTQNPEAFARSMARRFLINQRADNFVISVNGNPLPEDDALAGIQFDFPSEYKADEMPEGLRIEDGWAIEKVEENDVFWRVKFTKDTITVDEFRGISIFCGIKVAQTPFFFNLSGGLSGQHGQQYMSGVVRADYIDRLGSDIITTERQRINWENDDAAPLLAWGQERTKQLLGLWKARRAEKNIQLLDERVAEFSQRLERLPPRERRVVTTAIRKLAAIETLEQPQFESLAGAILTAWEGGRLRGLIEDVAQVETMDEGILLSLLAEAQVLTALHAAEAVKAKLDIIQGLRRRIESRDLENAVRNYIAEHPWLLSPEWETFRIERSVANLVAEAAQEAGVNRDPEWDRRVDLVLASGSQLLIVEFMRPGLTVDRDHLNRFQQYIDILREKIAGNTSLQFKSVSGLLVAEHMARPAGLQPLLDRLAASDMKAIEWHGLLLKAESQWKDFLSVLGERAPEDRRLIALQEQEATEDAGEGTVEGGATEAVGAPENQTEPAPPPASE